MNALPSIYVAHDARLIAQRDYEPSDQDIADRAEYLLPLLAKSKDDAGEILGNCTGTPEWEAFAVLLHEGDECEAGKVAKAMLTKATQAEAERLAEVELIGPCQHYDTETLTRIRANDVREWLRNRD